MIHNTTHVSNWLVTDEDRARAQIKYELNQLKSCLHKYLFDIYGASTDSEQAINLCAAIATKYLDYLRLLDNKLEVSFPEVCVPCRLDHFKIILNLEQQLTQVLNGDAIKDLIIEIISLYKLVKSVGSLDAMKQVSKFSHQLKRLFVKQRLDLWLTELIDFWRQHEATDIEFSALFHDWNTPQQQVALTFFAQPKFIDLVNAIFFYKLYPDKLFAQVMHPEKLISVRTRLSILHSYIELMQQQLYRAALQNGLTPGVDRLLHEDELPQGIMLVVDESFREIIQVAIKRLKVPFTPQNAKQATLELLHDLRLAYKFWFNPNRLIDAVMLLRQSLTADTRVNDIFQNEMVRLFAQLTTTECLDLYGYFANNDSRYLRYTFLAIIQESSFYWLPMLNEVEKAAVNDVFHVLCCVMDALRIELKNRHVLTEPYVDNMNKHNIHIGQRNRDAVLRVIAIYGHQPMATHDTMEQLFRSVEEIQ